METLAHHYLSEVRARLEGVKALADRAIAQLDDAELTRAPAPGSNSVAVSMHHIAGNQRSRFTDFLTSDGEKPWRERDREFEPRVETRAQLTAAWDEGWATVFAALDGLQAPDLMRAVTVRGEAQSALSAIERQLAHYAYHVGQIVYVARLLKGPAWQTLSIARGASQAFNERLGHRT